jgi:hypothetical protein
MGTGRRFGGLLYVGWATKMSGLISQGGTSVQIADKSKAFDSLDTLGSVRHLESRVSSAKVGQRELSQIVDRFCCE